MLLSVIMLVFSLGLILLAAYVFTNAIERLGDRFSLHQGAVGSILAAVGTALPETLIPIIAILWVGNAESKEIGIGAIAGAPFMLGTLAFFVTGAAVLVFAVLKKRVALMHLDLNSASRDLTFFICVYGAAVLTTFVHDTFWLKIVIALGLLASYAWYIRCTLTAESHDLEESAPLLLTRFFGLPPKARFILPQVATALGLMVLGAHLFVHYTQNVSSIMGISPLILSLIITPIATELPEKCNSVIWIGQKKDTLALGNITGAMVFQSSFPVVFGVMFTRWDLKGATMVSAVLALLSACLVLTWIKLRRSLNPYVLLIGGALYGIFILYISMKGQG